MGPTLTRLGLESRIEQCESLTGLDAIAARGLLFSDLVHYLRKAESDLKECEAALAEIDRKANDND